MQQFICVERSVRLDHWNMNALHSHPHYEIYYLMNGSRNFLFSNALYHLEAPCVVVIPPYTMHKTEGGPFERVNVDVSVGYLNEFQQAVLTEKAMCVLRPNEQAHAELLSLLKSMETVDETDGYRDHKMNALFSYYIWQLSALSAEEGDRLSFEEAYIPPLLLRVIRFLYENYQQPLTLERLGEHFFVSKSTLIYNFNKYLHCSPIEFLLQLRLTKAKELLETTSLSLAVVAEKCGFSSPNYFSLMFKRKEQLSPANYRKYRREKG